MNGASSHTVIAMPHGQVLLAILGLTVLGVLIWKAIARLTPGRFRLARTVVLLSWPGGLLAVLAQPLAMTLLPTDAIWDRSGLLAGLGLAASAGAASVALAVALTLATLLVSASRRLSRR